MNKEFALLALLLLITSIFVIGCASTDDKIESPDSITIQEVQPATEQQSGLAEADLSVDFEELP